MLFLQKHAKPYLKTTYRTVWIIQCYFTHSILVTNTKTNKQTKEEKKGKNKKTFFCKNFTPYPDQNLICDTIKGSESHVGNIQF